jgi:hypothetical protein
MINKLIEIEMIIKKTSLLGKSWENLEGCMVKKENKKIKKWWIHGLNHAPFDSREVNLPPQYTSVNAFIIFFTI